MSLNEITIEVTQQCPNRCIYCSSLSDMEKTESLGYATILQVVDDAVPVTLLMLLCCLVVSRSLERI